MCSTWLGFDVNLGSFALLLSPGIHRLHFSTRVWVALMLEPGEPGPGWPVMLYTPQHILRENNLVTLKCSG
jgi:hypothetical protein